MALRNVPYAAQTAPGMAELDQTFADVGALGIVPCTASGTNSITLTPNANTPTISAYANYLQFSFVAANSSTGNVTVAISGLAALNLYKPGQTSIQAASGDITQNVLYVISYNSALNGGLGGFVIVSAQNVSATFPVAGDARNLLITQSPNVTLNITADEIVVESALGGTATKGASISHTFNGATTGANGMDTGTLPTSGFVSIYEIYNPSTITFACLGTTASQTTIYGGANLPAGYTQSALLTIWATTSSASLAVATHIARAFTYDAPQTVATAVTFSSSMSAQTLASYVPAAAKTVDVIMGVTSSVSVVGTQYIAGDAKGSGLQIATVPAGTSTPLFNYNGASTFTGIKMLTAQTVFLAVGGGGLSNVCQLSVTGYTI